MTNCLHPRSTTYASDHRQRPGSRQDLLRQFGHPGWAETVWRYRLRKTCLEDMWSDIASGTEQVFTLLAQCEAEALALGQVGPLEAECRDHRGAVTRDGAPNARPRTSWSWPVGIARRCRSGRRATYAYSQDRRPGRTPAGPARARDRRLGGVPNTGAPRPGHAEPARRSASIEAAAC